jgi:WD40 repeat protein
MTGAPSETWAVALHPGPNTSAAIGAGVVVDHHLVLACEHVAFIKAAIRDELWVAFPRDFDSGPLERRRVSRCLYNGRTQQNIDLVLLELAEPVPASVRPARLRLLSPAALKDQQWRAYGFPEHTDGGHPAVGRVGDEGGYGKIHLSAESTPGVDRGFSGAALWSPEYEAVVGIVVSYDQSGDGHALTLAYADHHLPEMKLSALAAWRAGDADDSALAAWGWALAADDEAGRHWLPRARGVAGGTEAGSRFRGRAAALRRVRQWLDRPRASGRPMIVTGSPGVGKSAVLGRIVTTADPEISAALSKRDKAERATVGSVACAVHVKGKTALEVAEEVARAVGVRLPQATVDLMPALRDRLSPRPARFNLIVDALDEAVTPDEARKLINDVLVPLARTCAGLGIQVIVGTRRSDDLGDLLGGFGADADLVDLDAPEFFSPEDLAAYAQATLQLSGAERFGNPYADAAVAAPVAARIAALADRNFLIAGLVARARALRDTEAVDPARVTFTATVADALDAYVADLPLAGAATARLALTALAYAETPGLSLPLWQSAIEALGAEVTAPQLNEFARSSAANFLVETGGLEQPSYRLFHQALNDALLAARDDADRRWRDERELTEAWIRFGRTAGWSSAPDYLLRSLPQHAARVRLIDDLLLDDAFLLHAYLDRLLPLAEAAESAAGTARKLLLQRTPQAINAVPADRAALFSVVDRLDGLGAGVAADDAPYEARWAHTPPRLERTVLEGHSLAVHDVCSIGVDGRSLLASAGEDGTVRLWDPLTNQTVRVLSCHDDCIRGVCAVQVGGDTLLATASHDGTVCLWDPRSGVRMRAFYGHGDWVRNICAIPSPGGDLLASAGDDRTVRVWDPATGALRHTLTGHSGWVTAVTFVPVGVHGLLASTGFDGYVRLWDPVTGTSQGVLRGHVGWVTTLYAVRTGTGQVLLASAGYDGTVRLWDPLKRAEVWRFDTHAGPITDLCTIEVKGGSLLASTGEDGAIRLWDMASGAELNRLLGHSSWIRAVCELPMSDHHVLATAGDDGTVRLWDPFGGVRDAVAEEGRPGAVADVCAVPLPDEILVASAGSDGSVRLWDPADGTPRGEFRTNFGPVNAVCVVDDDGRLMLAAAGDDRTVQLWDVPASEPSHEMREHHDPVNAVCVIEADDGLLLASAGDDETVRLWRPHDGGVRDVMVGHRNWVTSLAVVIRRDRQVLASADKNGTVRLWDSDGAALWEQHSHHDAVNALCAVTVDGRSALVSAGADRTIRLWDPEDGRPLTVLTGHSQPVTGITPAVVAGREILASTSLDRTVRLWDLRTGRTLRTIPVHHRPLTCRYVAGTLVLGLDRGLLALCIDRAAG